MLDHDVKPGVLSDMGDGDEWPALRERIVAADIFVLGLPIWMGQPSSVAKRVLERLDAFLGETDDRGRMCRRQGRPRCHRRQRGRRALTLDAACFQSLNDVGFTIPSNAGLYWVGEAMAANFCPPSRNA